MAKEKTESALGALTMNLHHLAPDWQGGFFEMLMVVR